MTLVAPTDAPMPERDDAGTDPDSGTPSDDITGAEIGPTDSTGPARPRSAGRRRALGAVAIGFLAAACRNGEEEAATTSSPAPTPSPVGAGDPLATADAAGGTVPLKVDLTGQAQVPPPPAPTATGPELEQVYLPVAEQGDQPIAPPPTPSPAPESDPAPNPSDDDTPMVVVVDPDPTPDTTPTSTPTTTPSTSTPDTTPDPDTMDPSTGTGDKPDTDDGGGVARPNDDTGNPNPQNPVPVSASPLLVANRITFGASTALMNELATRGVGAYVADQLARTSPDPTTERMLNGFSLLDRGRSRAAWRAVADAGGQRLRLELTHATVLRATYSSNQLYEMMCQLWADHFNVDLYADGRLRHLLADHQENVIRPNAMGKFRDLLVATASSPAMLAYLDNDTSNANAGQGINENYGRELLELHTLGIDDAGNHIYTEDDVRAASMAMTGWSMVRDRNAGNFSAFVFRDNYHFTGDISLLNGAWTRGATTGKATGDSLLQYLAVHPSTASHIARKLCRRFVADDPPAALVASAAQVYLANDTDLVPTLRHILGSDEFAASAGRKLRRPLEYLAATLRATGAETATGPNSDASKQFRNALQSLDHLPWSWSQPDGFPDSASHWLSTDGLTGRWQLAARASRNRIRGVTTDAGQLRATAANGTVGELINGLSNRFGLGQRPTDEVAAIAAGAGLDPGSPASEADDNEVTDVVALLLAHPIFQTR